MILLGEMADVWLQSNDPAIYYRRAFHALPVPR
jgi:hypothetical protein